MIRFEPLPDNDHTMMPMLTVKNAAAMIEFYKKAFGATEGMRIAAPDSDLIMHAQLHVGNSRFAINDEYPQSGGSPVTTGHTSTTLHLQIAEGVDELYQQALDAGATSLMQPADMFWGDRFAMVVDPSGHRWSLGMTIPNPPEMPADVVKADIGS